MPAQIVQAFNSFKRRVKMSAKLMEYFNKQPRLGTLSTADKAGNVNVAYFGSPRMVDEKTVFMGLGKNRTHIGTGC